MGLMQYNGGGIIAMTGKNCVAIASDLRLGQQSTTLACDFQKTYTIHDKLIVGLAGLVTDMQTLSQRFKFRHNLYRLREDRDMRVSAFANMVSSMLYEKRFGPYYCEPIIAGLESDGTPFVMGMDLIGAQGQSEDFVVAGSNTESLFGVCESFYRNDMNPEELFETIAQCLLSGVDRDCLAGWGGIVHVITPDGTFTRTLKGRMD